MAEITDAEAIRFVNEQIRPMAERLRDLNALMDYARGLWIGGELMAHFANDADTVEDGREAEGVSRLTAKDVSDLVGQLATILTQFEETGVMDIIRKPCVRTMRVTTD